MRLAIAIWLAALTAHGAEWSSVGPEAYAQVSLYDWSEPAEHHAAAVAILDQAGQPAGSGVYVRRGSAVGVLTARHVVRGSRTVAVRWSDNTLTSAMRWTGDKDGADIAWIFASHAEIEPLPIADTSAVPGEPLEVLAFGGPQFGRMRNYLVTFTGEQYRRNDTARPGPMHGDSGGAILKLDPPAVLSVVSAGSLGLRTTAPRSYSQLVFPRPSYVSAFAARVEEKHYTQCPPGQPCPLPQYGPSPWGGSDPFIRQRPMVEVLLRLHRWRSASLRNRLSRVEARMIWLEYWTNWPPTRRPYAP